MAIALQPGEIVAETQKESCFYDRRTCCVTTVERTKTVVVVKYEVEVIGILIYSVKYEASYAFWRRESPSTMRKQLL